MGAPPSLLVILFLPPLLLWLCLQPGDVMTLPLHYWLVSSGDHPHLSFAVSADAHHSVEHLELANEWEG